MPAVSAEKEEYASRMNKYLDTYSRVLFCNLDNVRSEQMHNVRRAMRGKGEVLVGKKTMQKRILQIRADADGASEIDKKLAEALVTDNRLVGNLALVFTNQDIATVREVLREYRVQAPARVGAIAPVDVTIQAGNTGLEPTMTSFFQALNIPTKIAKGTVEIVSDKKVLAVGDKVDSSTAALLQKLGISPFFYAVEVEFYWQNGMLFTAEDLNTSSKVIEDSVLSAISSISAMSLATGILTEASFPHAVVDGFKNLLAASVESEFVFEEFNGAKLRKDVKEGKVAAAAPAAASKTAAPAAAAAPVEEEEEEDFGMGGLF